MKTKRLMLFVYDFPHKKTQDFIVRLHAESYRIVYVIAAPWKKLPIPKPTVRLTPRHTGLIHPRFLCKSLGIPYLRYPHNSKQAIRYLESHPINYAIVAGARILKSAVIKSTRDRIINIHPGLLPHIRGLDTLLWSIHENIPIGITAHFISNTIDSGRLIYKEKLKLFPDDTIIDVSLRLAEAQIDVLIKTLKKLDKIKLSSLKNLDLKKSPYHAKMPAPREKKAIKKFNRWLRQWI